MVLFVTLFTHTAHMLREIRDCPLGGAGGGEKVNGGKVVSVTSVLVILSYNTVTAASVKCCWLGPNKAL